MNSRPWSHDDLECPRQILFGLSVNPPMNLTRRSRTSLRPATWELLWATRSEESGIEVKPVCGVRRSVQVGVWNLRDQPDVSRTRAATAFSKVSPAFQPFCWARA